METIHFKGLNGIRAISALVVVVAHISISLKWFNLQKLVPSDLAGFGVTIFFTLSGFLITYLLLKEKETYQTISISKFYIRRILRIWPIYFLYIILVLLITHPIYNQTALFQYLFFVPNIPYVFGNEINNLEHYWSLGVEEQFYLFWPLVFLFSKKIERSLGIILCIYLGLKLYLNIYFGSYSLPYSFIYVTRFSCMAIGGIGAFLYYKKNKNIILFCNKYIEFFIWIVFGLVAFNRFHIFSVIDHELISILTCGLIFIQISNKGVISLDNKVFNYLGKISFGMYVYHPLIIYLLSLILCNLEISNILKYIVIYVLVILFTIAIAHISYYYFEKYFLNLKNKFSQIKSEN
jgi:peptidoglycan/LPS O-acetylase OafA/YrhL